MFGVTGHQGMLSYCFGEEVWLITCIESGNHGEDVKELYYYLDSTPTHSYMKYLYKVCSFRSEYLILYSSADACSSIPNASILTIDWYEKAAIEEGMSTSSRSLIPTLLMTTSTGMYSSRFAALFSDCFEEVYSNSSLPLSMPRTRIAPKACLSELLLTIEDPMLQHFISSLNSGSETRGRGPRTSLPVQKCPPSNKLEKE